MGEWKANWLTEALPSKRFEVMSGKYIVQYFFGAGSTAVVVPVIDVIGVGWTFTICMFAFHFLLAHW